MSDPITVNGNVHSYGSLVFKLDGDRYYGFTSVSFNDKRSRKKVYGMNKSHKPRGRSKGKYEVEAVKVKGFVSSVQSLIDDLAARSADGKDYGSYEFSGTLQYIESGETPRNVEFVRCVVVAVSDSVEETDEGLQTEFEIDVMEILRNGKSLAASEQ